MIERRKSRPVKGDTIACALSIGSRPWLANTAAIILFVVIAGVYQYARTGGQRGFCDLTSDAGNIASWAAAWDHPELFSADSALSNTEHFRFYATIHIPVVRTLARFTEHYGDAFIWMLGPHLLVYLVGYYLLGLVWLHSRFWAFVFALVNLVYIPLARGTFWGVFLDPLPRVTFAALLPFLLALVLRFQRQPAVWPWLMGVVGLLMFVHPVSAPTIAVALWVGFIGLMPGKWSPVRRLGYMLLLGMAFLTCALPFSLHFFTTHPGEVQVQSAQVEQILEFRLAGAVNPLVNVLHFLVRLTLFGVLPMGLVGAAVLYRLGGCARAAMRVPGLWLLGIIVASALLPILLFYWEGIPGANTVQLQFVRAFRYTALIMYMLFFRALVECEKQFRFGLDWAPNASGSRIVHLILIGIVTWAGAMCVQGNNLTLAPLRAIDLARGKISPHAPSSTSTAISALREYTPTGARILPIDVDALAVRYGAMRPVAISWKDGGLWILQGERSAITWYEAMKEHDWIAGNPYHEDAVQKATNLAEVVGAEYVILRRSQHCGGHWPPNAKLVWGNGHFSLIRIDSNLAGQQDHADQ